VADKEGVRKTGEAYVKSILPDYCLTPIGDKMVPIPYDIIGWFSDVVGEVPTVRMRGKPTITTASRITHVVGDEQGTGGGVRSGVINGPCRPITHSSTVRANKSFVVYDTALYDMNCAGMDGPGNTIGKVFYAIGGAAPYAGPLVDLEKMRAEAAVAAEAEKGGGFLDGLHSALDVVGFIPVIGEPADALNGIIYLSEGDLANAAISAAGLLPTGGQAATGGRLAYKGGKAVAEEGAEKSAKEITEEGAEQGAKKGDVGGSGGAGGSSGAEGSSNGGGGKGGGGKGDGGGGKGDGGGDGSGNAGGGSAEGGGDGIVVHGGSQSTPTDRIKEHLTDKDLDAARRESEGEVVSTKKDGTPFDHQKEVRDAQRGLIKRISQLKKQFARPDLSAAERTELMRELGEASRLLDKSEGYLPR
jgi:hypothetical protein